MFVAGVLQGTIFPDFHVPTRIVGRSLFSIFAYQALPNGTESWAKLFIWAFLAGFAERLVPDSLDRLSSKLIANKQSSISVPAGSGLSPSAGGSGGQALRMRNERAQPPGEVTKTTMDNALYSGEQLPKGEKDPQPPHPDKEPDRVARLRTRNRQSLINQPPGDKPHHSAAPRFRSILIVYSKPRAHEVYVPKHLHHRYLPTA